MQNVYLLVFIALAFVVRITLSIYDTEPTLAEYVSGNLLPEITGMLVELVLILVVVEAIQSTELKRRQEAELAESHQKQV
ncbi:hypothetical protein M9196_23255, partial [Vibrio sp. S4B1]|nr:hypothetical protein [Vibrio methylphosphonaticus]